MTATVRLGRVQDTARWAAAVRAAESARKDALFHDDLARRLVGADLEPLLALNRRITGTWPMVARTVLVDRMVLEAAREGTDGVLNLAAGYDTRPYRLELPRGLEWIEVDHADVLNAKARVLDGETPACAVERVALDLADTAARGAFFASVRGRFHRLLVLTEGLLYYLTGANALQLARDIHGLVPHRWIFDLNNAYVRDMIASRARGALTGTATMHFAPERGAAVFEPFGWSIRRVESLAKTAGRLGRLRFPLSWLVRLPSPVYGKPGWPWAGVCVAEPATPVDAAP